MTQPHYWHPFFLRGDGWYFIVPAIEGFGEVEGDLFFGPYTCRETANASMVTMKGYTAENDNQRSVQ